MKRLRTFAVVSGIAGLSLWGMTGCVIHEQPAQVEVYPQPINADVVVDTPPPDDVQEDIGVAPGPDYVWVGGFYLYGNDAWVWHRGHWERPPHAGMNWERGHWTHTDRGYHYEPGRWR